MIWYMLEISKTKPTQFRVSVVRHPTTITELQSEGFTYIGIYKTADELTDALEPYLHMEEGGA